MTQKPLPECGVVVLGGTAGVGLETALRFAEQGSRVVLLGRDPGRGASAGARIRAAVPGAEVGFVGVDASDEAAAVAAERECRDRLGAIDVLVCTTGPSEPPRLLRDIPIGGVRPRIEEIILPPLHMIHATLPAMREQRGGAVVAVASDAAKVATPGETLIGAAMAAIVMFCKAAALEVKREGVRINLLTPSLIADTPGAALIAAEPFAAKMFAKAAGMAHLGVAEASDLAAMAVFLAGPAARRITGQAISVNGGISVA
jgi:NAD(P)-dependent dehydrogenase (short-subunit alcohol dehydrogenase family)